MEHAKFWQEFFQLYKELPALWRVKSTEYSDRVLKSVCYQKLINKLREIYPNADRELVVKKINNFRTSYRKEWRRMRESQEMGKMYKPTLWYFDCLSFLDGQDESIKGKHTYEEEIIEEKTQTQQTSQDVNTSFERRSTLASKRCINWQESDEGEHLPTSSRRKKILHRKVQSTKLTYEEQQQARIDADILCKSWAVQYRDMQGTQKLIARKLISDILFHGCLGSLHMNHTIDIQEILLRTPRNQQINIKEFPSAMFTNNSAQFLDEDLFFNCDTNKRSPIMFNSSSGSVSPAINDIPDLQSNDIKIELA